MTELSYPPISSERRKLLELLAPMHRSLSVSVHRASSVELARKQLAASLTTPHALLVQFHEDA